MNYQLAGQNTKKKIAKISTAEKTNFCEHLHPQKFPTILYHTMYMYVFYIRTLLVLACNAAAILS